MKPFKVLSLLLLFMSGTLHAQKVLEGTVVDISTGKGISNANVSFTVSRKGCITDSKGHFLIALDTLPVKLIISHIGYKTYQKWITRGERDLFIALEPSLINLEEVEITGVSTPQPFYRDKKYSVIDYEIDNGLIFLLVYKKSLNHAMMVCKNLIGDTIATSGVLPFKPLGLFHDCLNNIHIIAKDSAFQIYIDRNEIKICYRFEISKFRSTLGKCVASTGMDLYFEEPSATRLSVTFYRINKFTRERKLFETAIDKEKVNLLRKNSLDFYFLIMGNAPELTDKFQPSEADLRETRAGFESYSYVNKVLYKPNNSFMQMVLDKLFLFNTTDGVIKIFDLEGNFSDSTRIKFMDGNGKWKRDFYADNATGKIYTMINKSGSLILHRVDIETGSLKEVLRIKHEFPQKMKIYNDYLYYLFDVPGENDNKVLFKQRL